MTLVRTACASGSWPHGSGHPVHLMVRNRCWLKDCTRCVWLKQASSCTAIAWQLRFTEHFRKRRHRPKRVVQRSLLKTRRAFLKRVYQLIVFHTELRACVPGCTCLLRACGSCC